MKEIKNNNQYVVASLTVEAALVLPILIFACYAFLFFFYVLSIQENLHNASTRACETVASYGYLIRYIEDRGEEIEDKKNEDSTAQQEDNEANTISTEEEKLVSNIEDSDIARLIYCLADAALIKSYVKKHMSLQNNLDLFIQGGYSGISFLGSNLYDENGFVTIQMTYKVKPPVFSDLLPGFWVVQSVRMHSFNGYKVSKKNAEPKEEQDEEMVYITESGAVYHTHSDCTYIKIILEQVDYENVSSLKNESGGRYYPCEGCVNSKNNALDYKTVYITKFGTRYHISTSCSKIKRSIKSIKLSEVGSRKKCSKCSNKDGGKE